MLPDLGTATPVFDIVEMVCRRLFASLRVWCRRHVLFSSMVTRRSTATDAFLSAIDPPYDFPLLNHDFTCKHYPDSRLPATSSAISDGRVTGETRHCRIARAFARGVPPESGTEPPDVADVPTLGVSCPHAPQDSCSLPDGSVNTAPSSLRPLESSRNTE